jgi:type III secretion protein Q
MARSPATPIDPSLLRRVSPVLPALRRSSSVLDAGAQITQAAAAALQAALKIPVTCEAKLLEAPASTRLLPASCCYVVLTLANDGEHALLEIEEGLAALLVDRLAGGTNECFCPGAISDAEAAALSFLGLCVLRQVRGIKLVEDGLAVRFACLARNSSQIEAVLALGEQWLAIDVQLKLAQTVSGCRLLLPGRSLRRLCARAPAGECAPIADEIARCSLPASLLVGKAELNASDLEQVSPGDALLLSKLERADGSVSGQARLAFDRFQLCGQLEGRRFTLASIEDAAIPPEDTMESATNPQPPPLPVQIEVELARVRIPVSQLAQLKPGAVLELGFQLNDPVVLHLGDRAFARAELVDVGGEVGARILSLLP